MPKKYVAEKLNIAVAELTDPVIMGEIRQDNGLGVMSPQPDDAKGIESKFRIAELLDIEINCVNRFKKRAAY
jgi:dimethylamine--corrinoid protein Co-methyltransferase